MSDVQGFVKPGYEPVEEVFRRNVDEGLEVGAACAVSVAGEMVVDLWAGWRDPARRLPWEEDTLVNVFSTTKGVSSIALAHAHSRGLVDYDARVAQYWPEFAVAGKEGVTVRQLLSHQAGLCAIDTPLDFAALSDPDRVADAIAVQRPAWTPGDRHGYHGISLGWYESELLRRVDTQHRTIGRYFADEIAAPLGLEFYIGLPHSVSTSRVAVLQARHYSARMVLNIRKLPSAFVRGFLNPRSITARTFSNPKVLGQPERYNDPAMMRIEIAAANGIGTARSVAAAYGELATWSPRLGISAGTLAALSSPAQDPRLGRFDQVLRLESRFSLGYCKPWPGFEFGSPQAFGTPGAGGSFGFADPQVGLGFCYAMNRMDFHLVSDPRERVLRDAALACARRAT